MADADPHDLWRRLHYDLAGLPPDPSAAPGPADVSALLASPRFGERWARHWLDIAGTSDSSRGGQNMLLPVNFRYRDFVIAAFNTDKPYDQFLREQIAGDLMPAENAAQRDEQLVATGFLCIGTKNTLDENDDRYVMTVVEEQIDSLGRSLLGLTLACARCHDHKFDPISTRDYDALAGILRSSEPLAGAWRRYFGKWTQGVQPLSGAPVDFTDEDLTALLTAARDRMGLGGKLYRARRAALQEAGLTAAPKAEQEEFCKTRPEVTAIENEMERLQTIANGYRDKLNRLLPFAAAAFLRDFPGDAEQALSALCQTLFASAAVLSARSGCWCRAETARRRFRSHASRSTESSGNSAIRPTSSPPIAHAARNTSSAARLAGRSGTSRAKAFPRRAITISSPHSTR